MQDVAWVNLNSAKLLAAGQRPLMQLWIEVLGVPIEISNLGGKNYLKDISFTSGGARMTPDPIAGQFSATISNEGNIFHPNHPTSAPYNTYFRAGRKVWIKLGGNYAPGGPRYWQRIIGYMDEPEFSSDTFELTIKGLDYMKRLSDMKFTKEVVGAPPGILPTPIDNYWGSSWLTNSLATTLYGGELYNPSAGVGAAGDAAEIGAGEGDRAAPFWSIFADGATAITSKPAGGPAPGPYSAFELEFVASTAAPWSMVRYINVCTVPLVLGTEYYVTFKYKRTAGSIPLQVRVYPPIGHVPYVKWGDSGDLDPVNNVWQTGSFSFTAQDNAKVDLWFRCNVLGSSSTFRIDEISIKSTTGKITRTYDMPVGCTGVYYVELDEGSGFKPVWPGKQRGDGWYYDPDANQFYFDEDKIVVARANSLRIYYFTAQAPEDVVADILVKAYPTVFDGGAHPAPRNSALLAMGNPVTGQSVDRVWFSAGSTYINAIKMLCERCNYRFYFNWNGDPKFVPAPTVGAPVFTTFNPQHFTGPKLYQDRNEIWNRIVIEGEKIAELTGWEDNMPSELKGDLSHAGSILAYGEHTLNIKNHLFQIQADITAMCIILLAAYKDPKWYFDFETPYNAVPLVLGDTVRVKELLDIVLPLAQRFVTHLCLIRNAEVSRYNVTYKCQLPL